MITLDRRHRCHSFKMILNEDGVKLTAEPLRMFYAFWMRVSPSHELRRQNQAR